MLKDQTAKNNIYTIHAGLPFVDTLANGLIKKIRGTKVQLADFIILLPTRRAVQNLRGAFLRISSKKPLLLPRLVPLGDLDEDDQELLGWEETSFWNGSNVKPAIADLERRLLLTKLVHSFTKRTLSLDQAASLAEELSRLLDQVQMQRLKLDDLYKIVPEDYAEHWQITLKFLELLTKQWPSILSSYNCQDPVQRRNNIIEKQTKLWNNKPPKGFVIGAGSTGSIPATADLLNVISRLPNGCIVLPGFDKSLAKVGLANLEPTHPQYGMAQLMLKMDVQVKEIKDWTSLVPNNGQSNRTKLLNAALRPPSEIHTWRSTKDLSPKTLQNIEYIECTDLDEESGVIALMMRKSLEKKGNTAALITPDRELARRVKSQLVRWDVEVNDAAGQALTSVTTGIFLSLTAELVVGQFKPVDLLAVCKHPIAACGFSPSKHRELIREFEVAVLRGSRPIAGIDGLLAILDDDHIEFRNFLLNLKMISSEFSSLAASNNTKLSSILRAHIEFAECIAASDTEMGVDRLWTGSQGVSVAKLISEIIQSADVIDDLPGRVYPAFLKTLMSSRRLLPPYQKQSRLHIWGLLEARLQHADLIILGGLNEGSWPPEARADPWMSRPMRKKFGLPLPEYRIGLSAHDFAQAFSAPRVSLTRSRRVGGIPTVPARWLSRLAQYLEGHNLLSALRPKEHWNHIQNLLDKPEKISNVPPPSPRPPVAARPRKLSVTQVEAWMRDPYSIYARHILRLEPLPELDLAPGAADYGRLIHSILNQFTERFSVSHQNPLPENAEDFLIELGRKNFASVKKFPSVWAFWWPRFLSIAKWFVNQENFERLDILDIKTEVNGKIELEGPQGQFTLVAIADRIDLFEDQRLRIIDYKTGAPPTQKEINAGFSPQLPLEAAIAQSGGFQSVLGSNKVAELSYWRLKGGNPAGEISNLGIGLEKLANDAFEGLEQLIKVFDNPDTPYEASPRSEYAPVYSDYEHLARVKEWIVNGKSSESGE